MSRTLIQRVIARVVLGALAVLPVPALAITGGVSVDAILASAGRQEAGPELVSTEFVRDHQAAGCDRSGTEAGIASAAIFDYPEPNSEACQMTADFSTALVCLNQRRRTASCRMCSTRSARC